MAVRTVFLTKHEAALRQVVQTATQGSVIAVVFSPPFANLMGQRVESSCGIAGPIGHCLISVQLDAGEIRVVRL